MVRQQTITIVLAVKNEEAIIGQALKNLSWVDEIIIIDNGSADKTKQLAKLYTQKVYSVNDKLLIPQLQQKGIEKATKDWIIVLDADVHVPEAARKEIQIKIQDPSVDGYYLIHKNLFLGEPLHCHYKEHKILKLFRRGSAYFEGRTAHESITFKGKAVGVIQQPLIHNAHPFITDFIRKINLYSSQDAEKLVQGEKGGMAHRKLKSSGCYNLFIFPVLYFFNFYFIRRGYLDGIRGIILGVLLSYYAFIEAAKVYELCENKIRQ